MHARTLFISAVLSVALADLIARADDAAPPEPSARSEPAPRLPTTVEWHGTLKDGTAITAAQLKDLTSSPFFRRLLTKQRSPKVDLSGSNIGGADLKRASLREASFNGALMAAVDLTGADLDNADLTGADLWGANLTGATLNHAKLGGANLYEAKMTDAIMIEADLSDANFDLLPGTLPSIQYMATATGLAALRYEHSPTSLIELREAFRTAGLREQASEVHFSIMHTRRKKAGFFEKIPLLAVEIPCAYGLRPGRPLLILVSAILAFWIPYIFALNQSGTGGIWITWPADKGSESPAEKDHRLSPRGFFRRLGLAFYFSVVSAFNIGWEDINIGSWIAQLQPREFTLKAIGWVRVFAGAQSLLGVYLVALSILSYFGHLFE